MNDKMISKENAASIVDYIRSTALMIRELSDGLSANRIDHNIVDKFESMELRQKEVKKILKQESKIYAKN